MSSSTPALRAPRPGRWAINLLMILGGLAMFAPILWTAVTALLPAREAYQLPPHWIPTNATFGNVEQVFKVIPFAQQILNSVKVAGLVTIGSLATSALAAYAFARLRFPGRDVLFVVVLGALMIPQQVTVIPTFWLMRQLHLLDNHAALILPGLVNVLGIFMLRQFFLTLPRSLDEAARIDGAGHLRVLVQIILPLSAPPLSALGIFIFQYYWNDFFWPNIFLQSADKLTVPVGLVNLQGLYGSSPAVVTFAAVSVIAVPLLVLFIFSQRAFTEGIALTGIRR
jgi:multiple sugar transport system permease protein